MQNKSKIKYIILFSGILGMVFFLSKNSQADIDCGGQCSTKCAAFTEKNAFDDCMDSCDDDCKALEKKEEAVLKNLQLNNKTQGLLQDQLEHIEQQQVQNQQVLSGVQNKLSTLEEKIENLKRDISEKEKLIAYQKKILIGLMQSYYDYDQQGVLGLVMWDKELSTSMVQADYIEQSGTKVTDVLLEIKTAQRELQEKKQELEGDYKKSDELKEKLQYEKSNLESTENQKQYLLTKTQGEEQKYQDMLAHIETQKKELFDFNSASNLGEIFDSVKSYPKPDKKNHASTSWYFAQTDSRWGNQRIGNSKSLMKDYGCAVSGVAMVFRSHGSGTDPGKLAKEKIFYGDLISWPSSWSPNIKRVSSISHGNVNWSTVKSEISDGNPVIVYIKRTSGGGGHYVVVTGKDSKDYIVHDPYFGANLYLGTSMSLIGKLGSNSATKIDQMIIYN